MKTTLLSILIPVYNERECLPLLYEKLCEVTASLPCNTEILFVNDGSSDDTSTCIKTLQQSDHRIVYVDLSRNYGKEIAVSAGIDHIRGDALVILDADLQDPPELIPEMLAGIEEGYDDVYGMRIARRHEHWFKRWTSRQYYRLQQAISNIEIQENTGDFRMFGAKAIAALRQIKESERNMKGLFSYIGFRKKCIPYEQPPRAAGSTKWNYLKLLDLAIKGWTSFSVLPLRIISFTGITVSIAALTYLLIVLFKALIFGDPVGGYPSLMCVILFLGGFVLLALGIIGEYLGIIYRETKKRPYYFVNEVLRVEP
ncbi:MAG: glycosyltransferase [Tannerella sp.]|jgi:glycosyltransferase involved in cell wall biosynthesis|nr:glycosyltransferase [Tannerella sp.]